MQQYSGNTYLVLECTVPRTLVQRAKNSPRTNLGHFGHSGNGKCTVLIDVNCIPGRMILTPTLFLLSFSMSLQKIEILSYTIRIKV